MTSYLLYLAAVASATAPQEPADTHASNPSSLAEVNKTDAVAEHNIKILDSQMKHEMQFWSLGAHEIGKRVAHARAIEQVSNATFTQTDKEWKSFLQTWARLNTTIPKLQTQCLQGMVLAQKSNDSYTKGKMYLQMNEMNKPVTKAITLALKSIPHVPKASLMQLEGREDPIEQVEDSLGNVKARLQKALEKNDAEVDAMGQQINDLAVTAQADGVTSHHSNDGFNLRTGES